MTARYENLEALVEAVGQEAMKTIRVNAAAYTFNTVTGSHDVFHKRCSLLLSDIDLPHLLTLLSVADCGHWQMPEHAGSLDRAVRFAVLGQIDAAFHERRIDLCFEWADGKLFSTLEQCAAAARKVTAVRASRDIASAGESIERFLARVRHLGRVPDFDDLYEMLVSRSVMFRPVVNDQWADWETLRSKEIDKPYLFELMTRLANYACLRNESRERFIALVNREAASEDSSASA